MWEHIRCFYAVPQLRVGFVLFVLLITSRIIAIWIKLNETFSAIASLFRLFSRSGILFISQRFATFSSQQSLHFSFNTSEFSLSEWLLFNQKLQQTLDDNVFTGSIRECKSKFIFRLHCAINVMTLLARKHSCWSSKCRERRVIDNIKVCIVRHFSTKI